MEPEVVECERCGSPASVLAVEGEIFPRDGQRPMLVYIISCPKCGEREQEDKR
jgi:hypothetical protein